MRRPDSRAPFPAEPDGSTAAEAGASAGEHRRGHDAVGLSAPDGNRRRGGFDGDLLSAGHRKNIF